MEFWKTQLHRATGPTTLLLLFLLSALDLGSKIITTHHLKIHLSTGQYTELRSIHSNDLFLAIAQKDKRPGQWSLLGTAGQFLRLKLYLNQHFAFSSGMHQAAGGLWFHLLFVLIYFFIYIHQSMGNWQHDAGFLLLLAGGTANWIDRLCYKSIADGSWSLFDPGTNNPALRGVTDFIDCIWFGWHSAGYYPGLQWLTYDRWPIFNLADAMILLGIGLLVMRYTKTSRAQLYNYLNNFTE